MQVEREPRKGGKRRKGEEHVGTYLQVWDSGWETAGNTR